MDKESALFYVVLLLFAGTGIVTLLGIVQKVSIEKKYLNALFSALILELIAAVLYLFSSTEFFDDELPGGELTVLRSELPEAQRDISRSELVNLVETHVDLLETHTVSQEKLLALEQEVITLRDQISAQVPSYEKVKQALDQKVEEVSTLRDQISAQVPSYENVKQALDQKVEEISALQSRYNQAVVNEEKYLRLEKQFLVKMARLNSMISEWGTSINFNWQPENKRVSARLLQEAFKQIGFMDEAETPNDDPIRARQLLIEYQDLKKFGETGFLTGDVIALIIRDYLSLSENGESATN